MADPNDNTNSNTPTNEQPVEQPKEKAEAEVPTANSMDENSAPPLPPADDGNTMANRVFNEKMHRVRRFTR